MHGILLHLIIGMVSVRLVWHRRDLRLADNALYQLPHNNSPTKIVSLFVLDPALLEPRPSTSQADEWDTVWTGPHALRALRESLGSLRTSLRQRGGELLVRRGDPLEVVPQVARAVQASEVVWHQEPGWYEESLSRRLSRVLSQQMRVQIETGCTLYHPDDLPATAEEWKAAWNKSGSSNKNKKKKKPRKGKSKAQQSSGGPPRRQSNGALAGQLDGMPLVMGNFRTAARNFAKVRPCLPLPSSSCFEGLTKVLPAGLDAGEIPSLEDLLQPIRNSPKPILHLSPAQLESICQAALDTSSSTTPSHGGGTEAWAHERLAYFIPDRAKSADRSRACVEPDHSSRFSLPLALGTLSPRQIYEKVQALGNNDDGCQWLVSHLEMRDFFLYLTFAAGSRMFQQAGLPVRVQDSRVWYAAADDVTAWDRWSTGTTGLPLVDAGLRELSQTGYCSNRVRQNCASVLTKDLHLDWRAGADLFQFLLADHCVAANWGNWMYFSGVGSDPKSRHFRTVSQALRYDPSGDYVSRWIPALRGRGEGTFRPWDLVGSWPTPVVEPETQYVWQDLQKLKESGHLLEEGQGDCDDDEKDDHSEDDVPSRCEG